VQVSLRMLCGDRHNGPKNVSGRRMNVARVLPTGTRVIDRYPELVKCKTALCLLDRWPRDDRAAVAGVDPGE
jgi:hypothetical protein